MFSCRGIEIAVNYFKDRGHKEITVFVPEWRKESSRPETPIADQHLLDKLFKEKHLVYTPSRKLNNGRRIICYDDRYIVRLAHKEGGVIVSNDQFRDLMQDNLEWKKVIEQRLLQFAFVTDFFMPPDDPLGKLGPTLDQFLSKDPHDAGEREKHVTPDERGMSSKPICPHLGNCTFGKKCRYYHPDREPQQQLHHHKVEQKVGGGLYRLPTTDLRSATPSPNPDNRPRGNSAVKLDPRGSFSNHSSTDNIYHEVNFGVVSNVTTPTSTTTSISQLSEEFGRASLHHNVPSKSNYAPEHNVSGPQPPGWVVSSPIISDRDGHYMEQTRPHNHTFPLAQLPHRGVREGSVTGDHSHLVNQGSLLISSGHSFVEQKAPLVRSNAFRGSTGYQQLTRHQQQLHQRELLDNTRLPQDTDQSQYRAQSPSCHPCKQQQQQQYHQPSAQYHHHLPPSSHQQTQDYYGYANMVTDLSGMQQDRYQSNPSNQLPLSRGTAGNMHPSHQKQLHHHMMSLPLGYAPSRSSGGSGVNISPSTSIPLHNLRQHHLPSSQSSQLLHASPYLHAPQEYSQATPTSFAPTGQFYPVEQGYGEDMSYSGSRHDLYRSAVAVLPGCEQRVQFIMNTHPELVSKRDIDTLLHFVQQMD